MFTMGPAAASEPAGASDYPPSGITIINPFPPGSPVDFLGRLVASELDQAWAPFVVVESRSGAGGTLGANFVARSKPDGQTLLVSTSSPLTAASALYEKLPYDPLKSLVPVWGVVTGGLTITVRKDLPVANLKELVAYAKAKPGELTYASSGVGTLQHFAGELFRARTQTNILHVPYRGGAPAMADLVGGHVDIMFDSSSNQMPSIQAGKVRALATLRPERDSRLPDVPTSSQAGVAGVEIVSWISIFAPAATPPDILDKLRKTTAQVMSRPEVVERLKATLGDIRVLTPAMLEETMVHEAALYADLVQRAGIQKQ